MMSQAPHLRLSASQPRRPDGARNRRWTALLSLMVLCGLFSAPRAVRPVAAISSSLSAIPLATPAGKQAPAQLPSLQVADAWPFELGWTSGESSIDRPLSYAWGDVDNDGDLDLAVGNGVSWAPEPNPYPSRLYRNDGGTLATTAIWSAPAGDHTTSVAWGDVDNDGDLDLAVGNVNAPSRIYRNTAGMLSADPIWSSLPGNKTMAVAWADVDGDADLDLMLGNNYDRVLQNGGPPAQLYRNQGGSLADTPDWSAPFEMTPTPSYAKLKLDWNDYDQDGDLDLLLGREGRRLDLYRNDHGTLGAAPIWQSPHQRGWHAFWDDVDRDGDRDLIVGGQNIGVYYSNGEMLASSEVELMGGRYFDELIAGDYDRDGDQDLLGIEQRRRSMVMLNNEGGSFVEAQNWMLPPVVAPHTMAFGDVDNDGDLDLALSGYLQSQLYYNTGHAALTLNPGWDVQSWPGAFDMTWGDVDSDLDLDLVLVAAQNDQIRLHRNEGGTLSSSPAWSHSSPNSNVTIGALALGDVDADGDLDLAVGHRNGAPTQIYGNVGGTFSDTPVWEGPYNGQTTPYAMVHVTSSLAWGDVDNDGYLDLAVGNYAGGSRVYRNIGGTLSDNPAWVTPLDIEISGIAWGDLDDDGDLDLAAAQEGRIQLYRNERGSLSTTAIPWASTRNFAESVAWGDVDGDGDLDLAAMAWINGGSRLRLHRNDAGVLSDNPIWSPPIWGAGRAIAWGDVDGDGDLDLANSGSTNRVYRNEEGQLAHTPMWLDSTMPESSSMAWGDVDGDGDLDLATAGDTHVTLYTNNHNLGASDLNDLPALALDGPGADANHYAVANILSSPTIPLTYTLSQRQNMPVDVVGQYSTDGGGVWRSAVPSADTVTRHVPTASYQTLSATSNAPLAFTSASIVTSTIDLTGSDYPIRDLDINLNINHSHVKDLTVTLTSPAGETIMLIRHRGGNGANLINTTLDSEATRLVPNSPPEPLSIAHGSAPFSGTYRPEEPLSTFYGQSPAGTWVLSIEDAGPAKPESGTLVSWAMSVKLGQLTEHMVLSDEPTPSYPTLTSTLVITDAGLIADLDVTLNLSHEGVGDLLLSLTSPQGETITLFNGRNLFPPEGEGAFDNMIFDSQASVWIGSAPLPYTGRYFPTEWLGIFDRDRAAGTWTLAITDYNVGKSGTLISWGLDLQLTHEQTTQQPQPLALPPLSTVTSTITLTETTPLFDLDVTLDLLHENVGDVIVKLLSPLDKSVLLFSYGEPDGGTDLRDMRFDDTAARDLSHERGPFSGPYRPPQALAYYHHDVPAGDWLLVVENRSETHTGTLIEWGLTENMPQPGRVVRTNSTSVPLPDRVADVLTSTLLLPSDYTISDLDVVLNLEHSWVANLEITLTSPAGTSVQLSDSGMLSGANLTQTLLDDEAFEYLRRGVSPYSGTFKPDYPLAVFDGEPAGGLWTLSVRDAMPGHTGRLISWGIGVTELVSAETVEQTESLTIPQNANTSTLQLDGSGTVADVDVVLDLEHPEAGDLRVFLVAPSGKAVLLMDQALPSGTLSGTTFDDQAAAAIADGAPPFSGAYRPAELLAALIGEPAGGTWSLAVIDAQSGAQSTLQGWSLTIRAANKPAVHTYTWDVFKSGLLGQSDNTVFRLLTIPVVEVTPHSTSGSYQYGGYASMTFPFRVRGTQVRVVKENGEPAPGALVYRLPEGKAVDGNLFADRTKTPFRTDSQGYLQGRGELVPGDRLLALLPITDSVVSGLPTSTFTLYYTNGTPTELGLDAFDVDQGGVQTIEVSAAHPLYLFDLSVALEWDAHADPAYLQQLETYLQRASRYLYDFTDGQVALGRITVTQNADNWAYADVVVRATNQLRPFATEGGIVITPTKDLQHDQIIYDTGQVQMGATWNRYGIPGQSLGDDWALILAHELGHYLLFLDDTYLGLTDDGFLRSISSCMGSAMGDVYQVDNTELIAKPEEWTSGCAGTLAAQRLQRTEWETLRLWYPALVTPTMTLEGPSLMPFNFTSVAVQAPLTPTNALADANFFLDYEGGGVSSTEGRAFLLYGSTTEAITDDFVLDLGRPTSGQNRVLARGAQPGDRLCVFDRPAAQFGCETIALGDNRVQLRRDQSWNPIVQITPVTSRTLALSVEGVPAGQPLRARLFPEYGTAASAIPLTETGGIYSGTLTLADPALVGTLQLWIDEEANELVPRRETLISYALAGNVGEGGFLRGGIGFLRGGIGFLRGGIGFLRGGIGFLRGGIGPVDRGEAPLLSPDGQMMVFVNDDVTFAEGEFYAVQGMAGLPPLPPQKQPIGQGYRLVGTANAPLLDASVNFQYLENDILLARVQEQELRVHFWNGEHWTVLETLLDTTYNLASAKSQGPGVYALFAGQTSPQIDDVTPALATTEQTTTLVISGTNFLPPLTVRLIGPGGTYTLTVPISTSTQAQALIPPGLPVGSYDLELENGDTASARRQGALALYAPDSGCFADQFESGLGKWQASGSWGVTQQPGGNTVLTDSPLWPYKNAVPPAISSTTTITSTPFSLAGCANPVLTFRHDYALASVRESVDWGQVEISADGGLTWSPLARYSGGKDYDSSRSLVQDEPDLEWEGAAWKQGWLSLGAYAGQTVQLRLSLTVDQGIADKGWVVDDIAVRSGPAASIYVPLVAR